MKIETERLVIRDFQKRDVVGLLEYLSNPRVNCFAADRLCSERGGIRIYAVFPKRYATLCSEFEKGGLYNR